MSVFYVVPFMGFEEPSLVLRWHDLPHPHSQHSSHWKFKVAAAIGRGKGQLFITDS